MNKAAKGYRKEYKIRKQLESEGYFIAFKSIRNRFGCIDFANLFDVVAYKGKERRYISSKHGNNGNNYIAHQKEIVDFKTTYGYPDESYELWLWTDGNTTPRVVIL